MLAQQKNAGIATPLSVVLLSVQPKSASAPNTHCGDACQL